MSFWPFDARIRRIRLKVNPGQETYYHTSAVAALSRFKEPKEKEAWLKRIPLDSEKSFWVNYPGRFSLFRRIPFAEIVQ